MKKLFALVLLTLCVYFSKAQNDSIRLDSTQTLTEFTVNAYFGYQPLMNAPFTVNTVDSSLIHGNHGQSMLPVMNLGPGIRMEERTPGSYRLSIRGSLLRSPFGVRNIKVYLDEFSFTDASGNTYLNLIDISSINRLEILRGPDASLFGANTGGVLRMLVFDKGRDTSFVQAGVSAGAYGFFRENAQTRQKLGKHIFSMGESWQRSDGYRENSSMDRKSFFLSDEWNFSRITRLRVFALYTDLKYLTPGGLTLEQFQQNPRAARPATAVLPGAAEQKAGVYNKTFYGGISNEIILGKRFRHLVAIFGSYTDFENPFIANYEIRNERNMGLRTWFEFSNGQNADCKIKAYLGVEGQQGWYRIRNYGNNHGQPDTLQAHDELLPQYGFGFARMDVDYKKFSFELSASHNYFWYFFISHYPTPVPETEKDFSPQFMPRIALSYRILPVLSWRIIASKGYSPPTLAEIRSSDNIINTALQPEYGWNYETGFRLRTNNGRVYIDLAGFYFALKDAIVRQVNENGAEYFINAGGTKQTGAELQFDIIAISREKGLVRKLKFCRSYTFSYFIFDDYRNGENNYSGNFITGVPQHTVITGLEADLIYRLGVFVQYQFTSRIPLNDANSVKTNPSHLLQAKISWTQPVRKVKLCVFAGGDNLLNQLYSLGNDLNAFGGRYYNAAPARNFYGGLSVVF